MQSYVFTVITAIVILFAGLASLQVLR
jgi:hypothetical protein